LPDAVFLFDLVLLADVELESGDFFVESAVAASAFFLAVFFGLLVSLWP